MTTITDAHRAEARRRLRNVGEHATCWVVDTVAQALAEPAWQPPVDPDLIEARECAALVWESYGNIALGERCRAAQLDTNGVVQSALIAIKRRQA